MGDARVATLTFRVIHSDSVGYANAPPLVHTTADFTAVVENGRAVFTLSRSFSDIDVARAAVASFVHAWEADAILQMGPGHFGLIFESAVMEARSNPPEFLFVDAIDLSLATDRLVLSINYGQYPSPPNDLAVDSDVEAMLARYSRYQEGKEPLGTMAHFCLTVLERGQKRAEAAKRLNVEHAVLRKLGELTTKWGGEEARKHVGRARPFVPEQRAWLNAATNRLIRRAAEMAGSPGHPLPVIGMGDLPAL